MAARRRWEPSRGLTLQIGLALVNRLYRHLDRRFQVALIITPANAGSATGCLAGKQAGKGVAYATPSPLSQ